VSNESLETRHDQLDQSLVGGGADIMAVEIVELGVVEAGRRAADSIDVEPLDRLLGRDDLVVAR
jgi:hypothetical protein